MASSTLIMTADELIRLPSGKARYELIRGKLHAMPLCGGEHGAVAVDLLVQVATYVEQRDLGVVFGVGTGFQLEHAPDTVIAPDLAFVHRSRIPRAGIPAGYWHGSPDLAAEVLSPDDSSARVKTQTARWLSHGAREVWLIDPKKRTVSIHCTGKQPVLLTEHASLTSDLLPGFSCRVSEIFAPLSEAS